jgi:hypothetical protein
MATTLGFNRSLESEDTFFETIARGPRGGVAVEKNGSSSNRFQTHDADEFHCCINSSNLSAIATAFSDVGISVPE